MSTGFTQPVSIRQMSGEALEAFLEARANQLTEEEALAALSNRYAGHVVCDRIARQARLTSVHSVRLALVAHRATPLAHSLKLLHFLHWPEILRLSTDVRVPPTVRRAMEVQLANKVIRLTLGEKITMARSCGREMIMHLLHDPSARVFGSLLINPRLVEPDLVRYAISDRAAPDHLSQIAAHRKWGSRYELRKALVFNRLTPNGVAAAQLRFLSGPDLRRLEESPETSIYLQRCIARIRER